MTVYLSPSPEFRNEVVEVEHLLQRKVTGWRLSSLGVGSGVAFNVGQLTLKPVPSMSREEWGSKDRGPEGQGIIRIT